MKSTGRNVPVPVKIKILFSGVTSFIGWFFFGFGMIFFWAFAVNADFPSLDYMFNDPVYADGKIIDSMETGASVNEETVYKHIYVFIDRTGREYRGVSYTAGTMSGKGSHVEIKYPEGRPELSRINGMRRKMFGPIVAFVVIFPLIGFIFIIVTVKKALSAIRFLKTGIEARGSLVSKNATNVEINDKTVYKMTFRFKANDGKEHYATAKTHIPQVLQDDRMERLFYNPENPSDSVLLDSIPGKPEIDAAGKIRDIPLMEVIASVIIPFLAIFGNLLYIIIVYII